MKKFVSFLAVAVLGLLFVYMGSGCEAESPTSSSGVTKAVVKVPTGPDGLTTEQSNVSKRLVEENKPGAVKHLYVISAMSGQVIIYSTVKGKPSSSSKRLTPYSVHVEANSSYYDGFKVDFGGNNEYTAEVLQDDGTYGSSIPYLYWWDVQGRYHQHYVSGGQIVHVSDTPLAVKSITINMELQGGGG